MSGSVRDYLEERERHLEKRVEALVAENARLKSVLGHMRKHSGECLGDNPRWMAEIDKLLAEPETRN